MGCRGGVGHVGGVGRGGGHIGVGWVMLSNIKLIDSIVLFVTCHSLRNFPPLIHIPPYPFVNF